MANFTCRDLYCTQSYDSLNQRTQHENLMHKNLLKEASIVLVDRIHQLNTPEKLNKKVFKTPLGYLSYLEIKNKIQEKNEESEIIFNSLKNVVEVYFSQYPNHGIKQIKSLSEFEIS